MKPDKERAGKEILLLSFIPLLVWSYIPSAEVHQKEKDKVTWMMTSKTVSPRTGWEENCRELQGVMYKRGITNMVDKGG
jgi:hypothetical protein